MYCPACAVFTDEPACFVCGTDSDDDRVPQHLSQWRYNPRAAIAQPIWDVYPF